MKELIYFMGRSVCHQLSERSFFIQNVQMPLCARCTGIYLGIFLGFLYLFFRRRWKGNQPPSLKFLISILICWIPMMIDGVTSYMGFRETNNMTRFITGLFFGIFMPVFIILLKNFQVKKKNSVPILKSYKDLFGMICMLFFSIVIFIIKSDFIWWISASITVLTILYVYIQIVFIIIRQVADSINQRKAYYIAFAISVIVMSGLALINQILLEQYR